MELKRRPTIRVVHCCKNSLLQVAISVASKPNILRRLVRFVSSLGEPNLDSVTTKTFSVPCNLTSTHS